MSNVAREMRQINQDAAQRLLTVMVDRSRRQAEHVSRRSYIGRVVDTRGPVIQVAGQNLERTSYRTAKGVALKNLTVDDEVLMTQTAHGIFVATQQIRAGGDDSDDVSVDGSVNATTVNADFVVTSNLAVNGPVTAGSGNVSGNLVVGGDLTVTGSIIGDVTVPDPLTVGELSVTTKVGFFGTTPILARPDYTVTNKTVNRTIDANSLTFDQMADILATVISDLQDYGLLRGTHN